MNPTEQSTPAAQERHTPGPWSYRDGDTVVYIQSGRAGRIADVLSFSMGFGPERPERNANARLIAAAPDLSAAAREALDFIGSYFGPVASDDPAGWSDGDAREVHAKLSTAIAKATGTAQ